MDVKCPHCGTEYEIGKSVYGRFVKCDVCGKGFIAGTSTAKKLGEAAKAAKDAVEIAAKSAYERAKNIDWKTQQEKAKIIADSACRKGKWFWRSLRDSYEEWEFPRKLSRWWYAFKVAVKAFVDDWKEQRRMKNFTQSMRKPTIRQLLVSAPWTIQFATAYLVVFGLALVVCNVLTSKFPTSILSSLIILAITIVVEYSLVRVRVVSWLLLAWGAFNIILLLSGSQDFACFWPFNVSFIAIAILLALPITQEWYREGPRINPVANLMPFKKVSVLAASLGIIAGIVLYCTFSSEQRRLRFLRCFPSIGKDNSQEVIRADNRRKIELYHSAIYKLDCGYQLTAEEAVVVRKVADLEYKFKKACEKQQQGRPLSASDLCAIGAWQQWKAVEDPSSGAKAMQDLYEREMGFEHKEYPVLTD